MATTPLTLAFTGLLAMVLSGAVFANWRDEETPMLLAFVGAITWVIFGFSAFSVQVASEAISGEIVIRTESMLPLVYLGFGLAALMFLLGFYRVLLAAKSGAEQMDVEETFS